MFIDPDGMKSYNPIYSSRDGRLLGSDSKGYEGEAIFMDDDLFYQGMDHDLAASIGTFFTSFDMSGMSQSFRDNFSMDATRLLFAIHRGDDPMRFAKPVPGNNFGLGPRATGAVQDVTLETVSTLTGIGALGRMAISKFASRKGVTVIGETMARVELYAAKNPGSVILNEMPEFSGTAYQVTSKMMEYNRKWILEQLRSGRKIVDLGLDPNRKIPSIFYKMEQNMLRNYQKLNH